MTPEEQGTRNIALIGRYLEYLLDHPEALVDVAGSKLVLFPNDDSELAAANAILLEQLNAQDVDVDDAQPIYPVRA